MGYQLIKLVQVLVALLGIALVASVSSKPASAQFRSRDRVWIEALEEVRAGNFELNKEIVTALENAATGMERAQGEARRAVAIAEQAQRDARLAQSRVEQLEQELRSHRSTVSRNLPPEPRSPLLVKVSDPTGEGLFRVRYPMQAPTTSGEVSLQSKKDPLAGVGELSGLYQDATWQRFRFVQLRDGSVEMWLTHSSDPLEVQGAFRRTRTAGHYSGRLMSRKGPSQTWVTSQAELDVYSKLLAIKSSLSFRVDVPNSQQKKLWTVSFHQASR